MIKWWLCTILYILCFTFLPWNIFSNKMMLISTLLHILLKTNFLRFLPWNFTDDVLTPLLGDIVTLLPRNVLADFLVNECRQCLFPVNANVKRHFMAFIPWSLDIATISYRNFLTLAYLNNCAILFRHGSWYCDGNLLALFPWDLLASLLGNLLTNHLRNSVTLRFNNIHTFLFRNRLANFTRNCVTNGLRDVLTRCCCNLFTNLFLCS